MFGDVVSGGSQPTGDQHQFRPRLRVLEGVYNGRFLIGNDHTAVDTPTFFFQKMAHPGGIGIDRLPYQQFVTDGQDLHQKPPGCHLRSADGQALDAACT